MALTPIEKECIQSAQIVLLPENNRRSDIIVIASVYCPPLLRWSPHHFTDVLNFAEKTLGGQTKFILCGDWNAKHRQCTQACTAHAPVNVAPHSTKQSKQILRLRSLLPLCDTFPARHSNRFLHMQRA